MTFSKSMCTFFRWVLKNSAMNTTGDGPSNAYGGPDILDEKSVLSSSEYVPDFDSHFNLGNYLLDSGVDSDAFETRNY